MDFVGSPGEGGIAYSDYRLHDRPLRSKWYKFIDVTCRIHCSSPPLQGLRRSKTVVDTTGGTVVNNCEGLTIPYSSEGLCVSLQITRSRKSCFSRNRHGPRVWIQFIMSRALAVK